MLRKRLKISDLLETPERTMKKVSKFVIMTASQGMAISLGLSFMAWGITQSFAFELTLSNNISLFAGGIAIPTFLICKYILWRLSKQESILLQIATKHRDAEEKFSEAYAKSEQLIHENKLLKEDLNVVMKELNRAILELACEKQKHFQEKRILQLVNEAIKNV